MGLREAKGTEGVGLMGRRRFLIKFASLMGIIF